MGIGTLVAIWVVANLPKPRARSRRASRHEIVSFEEKPIQTAAWRKDISEVYSTDGLDYVRKLARHQEDPRHWPCPFPPQEPPKYD